MLPCSAGSAPRGRHKTVAVCGESAYFDDSLACGSLMPETMTKTAEPVTIKKYANRRLYNTGTSICMLSP